MTALLILALSSNNPIPVSNCRFANRIMIEYVSTYLMFNSGIAIKVAYAESNFNSTAISRANSRGMFQISKKYEAYLASLAGIKDFQWYNPLHSAIVGINYLKKLEISYGDTTHSVAAYNCGPSRVNRYIISGEKLPDETINHINKIFG